MISRSNPHIPSLGKSLEEVLSGWFDLVKTPTHPFIITGWDVSTGKTFSIQFNKIMRDEKFKTSRGIISTTREATKAELDEIDVAIMGGFFQIEKRSISGCLGTYKLNGAGKVVEHLHRSTARKIPRSFISEG